MAPRSNIWTISILTLHSDSDSTSTPLSCFFLSFLMATQTASSASQWLVGWLTDCTLADYYGTWMSVEFQSIFDTVMLDYIVPGLTGRQEGTRQRYLFASYYYSFYTIECCTVLDFNRDNSVWWKILHHTYVFAKLKWECICSFIFFGINPMKWIKCNKCVRDTISTNCAGSGVSIGSHCDNRKKLSSICSQILASPKCLQFSKN